MSCSFKLTHCVWLRHDIVSVVTTQNLVEHETCGDDGPDVLARVLLQLYHWLRDVTPMSGDEDGQYNVTYDFRGMFYD